MQARSILLLLPLLLGGCNLVESPLSDVPITDPSVLQVIAVVDRMYTPSGGASTALQLNLYDKHGAYVKLLNGEVSVNGRPMRDAAFGAYVDDATPVLPWMRYAFTIRLSDGTRESCVVRTPGDLTRLDAPASIDRARSFAVSWNYSDPSLPLTLEFIGDTATAVVVAPAGTASLTVTPAMIGALHAGQRVQLRASFRRLGTLYGGFMSTSRVSATFSVSRWVQF